MRNCAAPNCTTEAEGFFCTQHWKELPWDKRAALTTSSKTGQHKQEALQYALDYFVGKNLRNHGARQCH